MREVHDRPTRPRDDLPCRNPMIPLGSSATVPHRGRSARASPGNAQSPSAREATKQRDATVFRLRWHANHVALLAGNPTATSLAASALADKLDACAPPQYSVPERRVSNLHARATALVRDGHCARTGAPGPRTRTIDRSACPWCRNSAGSLRDHSARSTSTSSSTSSVRRCKACGIVHYKLGLDVSLNQRAGVANPGFWQLQLWGFFHQPKRPWREATESAAQSERHRDAASQGGEAGTRWKLPPRTA